MWRGGGGAGPQQYPAVVQDSLQQPNVVDTLRRVSTVFAKHVSTGESWRREAFLTAQTILSRARGDAGGRSISKADLHRHLSQLPQWAILQQFSQFNFVSPQWTCVCSPQIRIACCRCCKLRHCHCRTCR